MKENYYNLLDAMIGDHFKSYRGKSIITDIRKQSTLLLVLDMQNYFLDPQSHAYVPTAKEIIPNINSLIQFARHSSIPIAFTQHSNNPANAAMMGMWWDDMLDNRSRYFDINKEILYDDDMFIEKHQYDAFYNTDLDNILISKNIKHLIICGVMTHLCCETTLRHAFVKGYIPIMPYDATATYNLNMHQASLTNLYHGFTFPISTKELILSADTNNE